MITTNNKKFYKKINLLKNHGIVKKTKKIKTIGIIKLLHQVLIID